MYDLLLNEDEAMIADSVREFLAAELPLERLRPHAKPVDLQAAWQGMAELGWFGVGLPEDAGGSGMSLIEEMLIQRECGRNLASPCVPATVLAGHICWLAQDGAAAQNFASGGTAAALGIDTAVTGDPDNRQILVLDWNGSDPVVYWNDEAMMLFDAAVIRDAAEAEGLDESLTAHRAQINLSDAAHRIDARMASLADRADILIAAAMVGLAEKALELTSEYAKTREQFGKPIGAFQAVKHRCADMAVRHRLSWQQTCHAALKLQNGAEDAPLQIASARLLAAEAAASNGAAAIQIHGGIGFQAECDAHWFLKRAKVLEQIGGTSARQIERILAQPMPAW